MSWLSFLGPSTQPTDALKAAESSLRSACGRLGWGGLGAEYIEVRNIINACLQFEQLGGENVWAAAVRMVEAGWSTSRYLIDTTKQFAQLVKEGQLHGLDRRGEAEANSAEIFAAAEKFEAAHSEIAARGGIKDPDRQADLVAAFFNSRPQI